MPGPGSAPGSDRAQAGPLSRAELARALVRTYRSGVLSTHSARHPGFPYGSALPHVSDHAGRPVVLISHLAEHTHNLEADARASFIVCAAGPDLQARPRVTLLGRTLPVADQAAAATRYLRFYPDHERYLQVGGFRFFALEPEHLRFIQGFGGLHWIGGENYLAASADEMHKAEPSVLEHMNSDHRDELRRYCKAGRCVDPLIAEGGQVIEAHDVQMIGVDCDGCDLRADGRQLRLPFERPVASPAELRSVFAALSHSRGGDA